MKANNNGWTDERKAKQSAMIHQWQPWQYSTGAKTEQGKEVSKMNAKRITIHGLYRQACKLYRAKQLYLKGHISQAWALMADNKRYMTEREHKEIGVYSPKAEYCKDRRRKLKN